MTTVPVKIIKLLCTDLTNKIEEEYAGEVDSEEEEDEEDDDESGPEYEDEEQQHAEADETAIGRHTSGAGGGQNTKGPIKDQYAFLSDYLESQGPLDYFDAMEDEADVLDPDVLNDPIYQMDMKDFLVTFFQQCIQQNSSAFAECVAELSEVQKQTLSALLEK